MNREYNLASTTASPALKLREFKPLVDARLQDLFTDRVSAAGIIDPKYAELITALSLTVMQGGKRFRPYLAALSYKGYGGNDAAAMLELAASQELMHNFFLVHDDVIDRDFLRHGGDNISGIYRKNFHHLGEFEAQHLADSMAILAGDVCFSMAYELIMASTFTSEVKVALTRRLNRMVFEIAGGEQLDTIQPAQKQPPSMNMLLKIYQYKTAGYSFETPLHMGAIAAGQPDSTLKRLSDYAIPLGVAYQLVDDLLGMFGDEAVTGKPNTSDLREGKQTILVAFALEHGTASQQSRLVELLGQHTAGEPELAEARRILEATEAKRLTLELIETYAGEAARSVDNLGLGEATASELRNIIDSLVHRVS